MKAACTGRLAKSSSRIKPSIIPPAPAHASRNPRADARRNLMRRTGSAHLPAEASVVEDPEDGSSILDLDDIPGPIMTPEFQTPVGFYKLRNQPNIIVIQGTA